MSEIVPVPIAEKPSNEAARAAKVERMGIAGLDKNQDLTVFGEVAKSIVGCDFVFINVSDAENQYTTCSVGLAFDPTEGKPREETICQWAMCSNEPMIVPDLNEDERFAGTESAVVMGVKFYAGFPLVTPEGFHLGVMCLVGLQRVDMSDDQIRLMKNLARAVTTQLLSYGDLNEVNAGRFSNAMVKFKNRVEGATLDDLSAFLAFCNTGTAGVEAITRLSEKGLLEEGASGTVLSQQGRKLQKDMNISNESLRIITSPISSNSNEIDDLLSSLEDM